MTHHQGNANEKSLRYHLTPVRTTLSKRQKLPFAAGRRVNQWSCYQKVQRFSESRKRKRDVSQPPRTLCRQRSWNVFWTDTGVPTLIAASFTISERRSQAKRSCIDEQIKCGVHAPGDCPAIHRWSSISGGNARLLCWSTEKEIAYRMVVSITQPRCGGRDDKRRVGRHVIGKEEWLAMFCSTAR